MTKFDQNPGSGGDRSGTLVVGSATVDVTVFTSRAPRPGETVLGETSSVVPGGKGSNQAIASARAGAPTYLVGCVGRDMFRDMVVGGLESHGVDLTHLRQVDGPTGLAHIRVSSTGENDIVVIPNANASLTIDMVDDAIAVASKNCSVLLTQLETPLKVTEFVLRRGRESGLVVILDPAPAAELPEHVWQHIDIVTPNETEAAELTGIEVTDEASAILAGRWFTSRGTRTAIITCAEDGVVVVTADDHQTIRPSRSVTAVDTTAAGDAFAGYLAAALAQGVALKDAVRRGMAAGALAVTKPGASSSIPALAEVERFLRD